MEQVISSFCGLLLGTLGLHLGLKSLDLTEELAEEREIDELQPLEKGWEAGPDLIRIGG